jgi:hypothetical protein
VPRVIKVATTQMDATPAPTADRLARAERLVNEAAQAGAQLVVLPEFFNAGFVYDEAGHRWAERLDGPTAAWMKEIAARLKIHLAGSLMLLDQDEVYNALLLVAPDGRTWRYDKIYPWALERGYVRDGNRITVAETDLGDLGMMICWDTAHPELWRRYAGRVDMMVIASCPPDVCNPTFHFPNGDRLTVDNMGPLMAKIKGAGRLLFGDMLNQQAAWLGVPAVNTVVTGQIKIDMLRGLAALPIILPVAPWLAKYLPQVGQMQISCGMLPGSKVVDAGGRVLTELTQEQGETFTVAEVSLADEKPSPQSPQPASLLPGFAYFASDILLPLISIPVYRKRLRRAWGEGMAPLGASTRRWMVLLGLGVVAGFLVGVLLGRRKS